MSVDLYGPLPRGTTVLEASAGTGKTWTIAALATRYVAEGHAVLSELLVATFSRAATHELRARVRERLASTARGLGRPGGDALVQHLSDCDGDERVRRRHRLLQALSQFDAATIATTHSFCSTVLDSLGMAGEAEVGVRLVESADELLAEIVDDLYVRKYAAPGAPAPISAADARAVARAACADGQARLEPAGADPRTAAGQRVRLAQAVRVELARRKRAQGVRDYDDLLTLLRDVLADPAHGPAACERLQQRYRVVLVDEFQDTDPVQWEVLRRAFHGRSTLVLIGDPKQAIYGFRGAEVLSYLDAVGAADRAASLSTNWRTDAPLLRALDHLHGGVALGDPRIVVPSVRAVRADARLSGSPPLRLRVLSRDACPGSSGGSGGMPAVADVRRAVARDVAAHVVALLEGPAQLDLDGAGPRPVQPGDIAVLVRRRAAQGDAVQQALAELGVPSVQAGTSSVFATPAAREWWWLLQAVEQPQRAGLVRLASLTSLVGRTATELAHGDAALEDTCALLRRLARRFDNAGMAALVELLSESTALDARVLALVDGERRLTDLRHVAQLLHSAVVEHGLGLSAALAWLGGRLEDPESGSGGERTRRLPSDAAAVQVMTVHRSKGLEFPVVLAPYGWDAARSSRPVTLRLHDAGGARVLDVGGRRDANDPEDGDLGYGDHLRRAGAEDDDEELRLLYVAVTRAQCQLTLWWAPSRDTARSPLHRLLMGRAPGTSELARTVAVPSDEVALAQLRAWGLPADIEVEPASAAGCPAWQAPAAPAAPLRAATFDRELDTAWRRTSYSALTRDAHDAEPGGGEPEEPGHADEPDAPPLDARERQPAGADQPSPFTGLPSGASFGTLVHAVLETVDATAADLPVELHRCCAQAVARALSTVDPPALAAALLPVLRTPLAGPGGPTLAGLAPAARLPELPFELALSGGDRPTAASARLGELAVLLRTHLLADDPLAGYADRLEQLGHAPLRGYLTGSIDAVLRLPGPRFVVVDYKTNRLAPGELTLGDYSREAMAREMMRAHYPLQALLYSVALHRYLRWRLPGYDPQQHLAGVQYLFVRGMGGPATPPGCGVFDWAPRPALVEALSDLLAGGRP